MTNDPERRASERPGRLGTTTLWLAAASMFATCLSSRSALGHVELTSPEPRERARDRRSVNSNLKRGPCGQEQNRRTGEVSVFEPGETIGVTYVEYVNHDSYYRIAFDVDGDDDLPRFSGYVSRERDDPEANCPVDGKVILAYDFDDRRQGSHEMRVTLPDVECDNCTLQVVQYMYGSPSPYYFQCADLVLRREGARDGNAADAGARREDAGASGASDRDAFVAADSCWKDVSVAEAPPMTRDTDGADGALEGATTSEPSTGAALGGSGCSVSSATAPAHRSGTAHAVLLSLLVGLISRASAWRRPPLSAR